MSVSLEYRGRAARVSFDTRAPPMVPGLDPVTRLRHAVALFRRVGRNGLARFASYSRLWQLLKSFPGIARRVSRQVTPRAPSTRSTHARPEGQIDSHHRREHRHWRRGRTRVR